MVWCQRRSNDTYESDQEDPERKASMYSANTMHNFRYVLNRILKSKGHLYDIISPSSLSFKRSQKAFTASQKELKERGKAEVHSAPEITEEGMYLHFYVIVNSCQFFFLGKTLKKNQNNVMYHFFTHRSHINKSKVAY